MIDIDTINAWLNDGEPAEIDDAIGHIETLVAEVERLRADLACNAQMLAKQTDLVAVLERALARSQSAEADVAGLLLRAERAEAEVARLKARLPVPPTDPRTCDHSWYVFDGSAHCYGSNDMRHGVPSDWTGQ